MIRKKIKIRGFQDVQEFNQICTQFPCDMDLAQGKYLVDAKSIMGIFSLNLERPVELLVDMDDEKEIELALERFILNED